MVTEEWNYIEGLYYSFITISTIGFGDFVAGEFSPFLLLLPPHLPFQVLSSRPFLEAAGRCSFHCLASDIPPVSPDY
jgi:hypothetical protein